MGVRAGDGMVEPLQPSMPEIGSLLDENLVFASVAERDVDFLLVEEFRSSSAFQRWFLQRALPESEQDDLERHTLSKVLHSVSAASGGLGETDLVLVYDDESTRRIAILIENKVGADAQERQGERYQQRKQKLLTDRACDDAVCVLIAPREYAEKTANLQHFDQCIAYEDILAHWQTRTPKAEPELAARLSHRCEVLQYAIEGCRRRCRPVPDEQISRFWRAHAERARMVAPHLRIARPAGRPARSTWVYFNRSLPKDPRLPTRDLYHKMASAQVHFILHGWGVHLDLIEPLLKATLDADMHLTTAGRALAIGAHVPRVDMTKAPESQYDAIDAALRAASRLLAWHLRHHSLLHECAEIVRARV